MRNVPQVNGECPRLLEEITAKAEERAMNAAYMWIKGENDSEPGRSTPLRGGPIERARGEFVIAANRDS